MPDEILDIHLEILPKRGKFPLKVEASKEALVREAAKQFRLKILSYQQNFASADLSEIDLLSLVAIDITVSHLQLERNNDMTIFTTKIQQLNDKLKGFLKEQ